MRHVTVEQERTVGEAGDPAPGRTTWCWLLTRDRVSGLEVFTERTPEGAKILPVFGSADDARAYLAHLSGRRGSWRPRKTGRGELVSVLMGVCREASWVTLDPPPGMAAEEARKLFGVSRDGFLEPILGRGRFWFQKERERQRSRRSPDVSGSMLPGREHRRPGECARRTEIRTPEGDVAAAVLKVADEMR